VVVQPQNIPIWKVAKNSTGELFVNYSMTNLCTKVSDGNFKYLPENYRQVFMVLSDFFKFHLEENIIYLLSFLSVDPKIQREKT
jgi:hypothetical protein